MATQTRNAMRSMTDQDDSLGSLGDRLLIGLQLLPIRTNLTRSTGGRTHPIGVVSAATYRTPTYHISYTPRTGVVGRQFALPTESIHCRFDTRLSLLAGRDLTTRTARLLPSRSWGEVVHSRPDIARPLTLEIRGEFLAVMV